MVLHNINVCLYICLTFSVLQEPGKETSKLSPNWQVNQHEPDHLFGHICMLSVWPREEAMDQRQVRPDQHLYWPKRIFCIHTSYQLVQTPYITCRECSLGVNYHFNPTFLRSAWGLGANSLVHHGLRLCAAEYNWLQLRSQTATLSLTKTHLLPAHRLSSRQCPANKSRWFPHWD